MIKPTSSLLLALLLLIYPTLIQAASSNRIAHVFDTSEEIVITNVTGTGSANYTISNAFGETISGNEPIVNGTVRIPAYYMTSAPASITVNGQTIQGALVPGVLRYSDHLVSPISQHLCPIPTVDPAGHAYLFLQLGFAGTNNGDTRYQTSDTTWLTFQKAMNDQGLYTAAKEGWRTPWPLTSNTITNWSNWLKNNGINNLYVTIGNEFEEGGFWSAGNQAYYDYTNLAYATIKQVFPEALIGGPDGVIIRDEAYDGLLTQTADSMDYFSFHQTAMGVNSGAIEGDVHTWVAKLKQHGISRPMADGEMMSGSQGGLRESWGNTWSTYWHANGLFNNAGLAYNWPSSESSILGLYMRGVVRTDLFNPCYENQPLWNYEGGPGVNPIKNLHSRATAVRTLSDWLSGSYPLGRIDINDNHSNFNYLPRTEIWATKRGDQVGLWMWTNENHQANYTKRVEIYTNASELSVIDNQGNLRKAPVENGVFRIRISGVPVFVTGFSDIPQVRAVNFSNQAPRITSSPPTETVVGGRYLAHIDGYDPEDQYSFYNRSIATFSLTQAPSGMNIDSISGRIAWKPTSTGTFPVTIRYRDPQGLEDTLSYSLTVKAANQNVAPYFVSNPVRIAPLNKQYVYTPIAIDPNGDTLTYSLTQAPNGATIDSSGVVRWTPNTEQESILTIQATDGRGGSATQSFAVASGIIAIRTRGGWPEAPTNLIVNSNGAGAISLSWNHNSDNSSGPRDEKAFVIERSSIEPPSNINNQFGTGRYNYSTPFEMIHVTKADETSWTDYPSNPGTYYYRVKAVNHIADWGGYSNIGNASTSSVGTPSPIPSSQPTPIPTACQQADINQDGIVDLTDYSLLATNFLSTTPSVPRADINSDGIVDLTDYSLLARQFLNICT